MDLESYYEIASTVDFIQSRNFSRVALQFPDELLKDSTKVVRGLKNQLLSLRGSDSKQNEDNNDVGLFVMADTTYGSCCVDEVGASRIDADCVVHYGHTCLSPTSALPAFFVFGKASVSISKCVENISMNALAKGKPVLVLYGLEYAHAIPRIREAVTEASNSCSGSSSQISFANVLCSVRNPIQHKIKDGQFGGSTANDSLGMEAGMRYDATDDRLVTDVSQQLRILKRRYYLVEKAKDANMVGILVGTLGVAGYLHMIDQMKELISNAGKKAYTLVMGRPNPAKLANFPECDVFINVSCAQTALLDSKEFLAPVITPFEAMLAFNRGSQWTGAYVMEFRDLVNSLPVEGSNQSEEARYSFIKGGYVEDSDLKESVNLEEEKEGALALASATAKALQLQDANPTSLISGNAKSGAEFFIGNRSYHGLEIIGNGSAPEPYIIGRSGKASGYKDEKSEQRS